MRRWLLARHACLGVATAFSLACGIAEAAEPPAVVDLGQILGEPSDPDAIDDLPNPPEIRSQGGVLETTFTTRPSWVRVAGKRFRSNVYNGLYIPPTLMLRQGETLRLTLHNQIGPADVAIKKRMRTNVHYHGTDVSPKSPGDDVLLDIRAGKTFNYVVPFPKDHPKGLHWYHPHSHGFVEPQILSGMSGMLIVDGYLEQHYPELADLRRRVMVFKDIYLPGQDPNSAITKTLNGYSRPPIRSRPDEWQIWQIGNLGADGYFKLALDGHEFWALERDGNVLPLPERQDVLFLSPGARTTVAVRAGEAGRYRLRSLEVDTGPQGDPNPEIAIGTLVVDGEPKRTPGVAKRLREPAAARNAIYPLPRDIKNMEITRERTMTFSETADGNSFFINNKQFDPNVVNTTARVGDVERWRLRNTSGELHVFHLHQTAFLVQKKGEGVQEDVVGMRDVINLPYARDGKPGEVDVIIPFTNPVMVGKFVYHCHIVGHEDAGMMQIIRVLPRRTAAEEAWEMFGRLLGTNEPPPWWPERAKQAARLPEANELSALLRGQMCLTPDEEEEDAAEAGLWVSGKGPIPPAAEAR